MCLASLSPIADKIDKLRKKRPDLVKFTKIPPVARALELIDETDWIDFLEMICVYCANQAELTRTPSTGEYKIVLGSDGVPLKPCEFTRAIEQHLTTLDEIMATLEQMGLKLFGSKVGFDAADAFDASSPVIPERIMAALYSLPYATDEHDTPIPTGGAAAGAVFGYWLYTCTDSCTDSCTDLCK